MTPPRALALTPDGCRARQKLLRAMLGRRNLDAALFRDIRYVAYFTGFWCAPTYSPLAFVNKDGPTVLVAPFAPDVEPTCDDLLLYESNRLATLVPDQADAAWRMLTSEFNGLRRLGCDAATPRRFAFSGEWVDIEDNLRHVRRRKLPDEVGLVRHAIAATEAAYQYAFDTLAAGITETDLYAGMLGAAAKAAGEPIGDFGNDFQCGASGGPPRPRPAQAGEIAVLDLSVMLRGYRSDLCRSFVVGRQPTDAQLEAHGMVMKALSHVEAAVKPGVFCRQIDAEVRALLRNKRGWEFPHHLGHGLGLDAHEAPRLNPNWDETFAVGDLFTVEPGLYHPELRGGLRIEHNYFLSDAGLERLSVFPTELA